MVLSMVISKLYITKHINSFFASVEEINAGSITKHSDFSYRDYLCRAVAKGTLSRKNEN